MAKYKISGDGVRDTETGASIPNDTGNVGDIIRYKEKKEEALVEN